MSTRSPRRARRNAVPGSLVAASVLCAVISTGYAGCFLPDYAKQGDEGATNGTPGATTGNQGGDGTGAAGASGTGGSADGGAGGGGPALACDVPDDPPSNGACVKLTTPGAGGAGGGGGAGGAGGAGGSGPAVEILCNPVTNEPCTAGNACDTAFQMNELIAYQCYGGQNDSELCEACDLGPDAKVFCAGGLTCIGEQDATKGKCARYCCTDADCGSGGECAEVTYAGAPDGLGLCLKK